jgi:magnesium transporter
LNQRKSTTQRLQPEVRQLIQQGRYGALRDVLHDLPPPDVADILVQLDSAEAAVAFRILPRDDAGEVFSYFPPEKQERLIHELGAEASLSVVEGMEPDDRARLLDELPAEVAQRLIASMSPANRGHLQAILGYPEESVGRLMTPEYVAVRPDWTVAQAMEHIRRNGRDAETIDMVYVVDELGELLDDIRLRQIFLADPPATVESLMDRSFVALRADQDQEDAVRTMSKYDRGSLPVVDRRGALIGIVTFDDVADIAEQEATEDFHRIGGVEALGEAYSQTRIVVLFRKRIGWLLALVGVGLVSSGVIAAYEETLTVLPVLAFFLPLLIDSAGNVGSQAATLMVRALATADLTLGRWVWTVRRELAVGVALGGAMAVASGMLGYFRGNWEIGVVVGLAMFCIVLMANIIGSMLPFILIRLRIDPAVASSPLITTIADSVGLLIYFSIATLMLTQLA